MAQAAEMGIALPQEKAKETQLSDLVNQVDNPNEIYEDQVKVGEGYAVVVALCLLGWLGWVVVFFSIMCCSSSFPFCLCPFLSFVRACAPLSFLISPPSATGEVFLARDRRSKRRVALKKMQLTKDNKKMLVTEIEIMKSSKHPNLVEYIDCFNVTGMSVRFITFLSPLLFLNIFSSALLHFWGFFFSPCLLRFSFASPDPQGTCGWRWSLWTAAV
jgi:hypothetical protein